MKLDKSLLVITIALLSSSLNAYELGDLVYEASPKNISSDGNGSSEPLSKKSENEPAKETDNPKDTEEKVEDPTKVALISTGDSASVSIHAAKYYLGGGGTKSNPGIPFYLILSPNAESRLTKDKIESYLANNDTGLINIKTSDKLWNSNSGRTSSSIIAASWSLGFRAFESLKDQDANTGIKYISNVYANLGLEAATPIRNTDFLAAGAASIHLKFATNYISSGTQDIEEILEREIDQNNLNVTLGGSFYIEDVVNISLARNIYSTDDNEVKETLISFTKNF